MPKSKNTRKKAYRPRQVKIGPYWPAEQQADVEDKLTKVALYVESTLPTGAATEQQIDWIEDVFIWFLRMLYKRHKHLDPQEVGEVGKLAMDGKHALKAIIDRMWAGQTHGYVATGEELKLISQACAVMIPTLKEAVRLAPWTSFNEFNWSQNRADEKLRRKQNERKRNLCGSNDKDRRPDAGRIV